MPVGMDAQRWLSRSVRRTVLVVVHSEVSLLRLIDVVDLIESDERLQVVFTVGPDVFNMGIGRRLDELGALTLPWHQAIRSGFDLALAASYGGLHELHAPILVTAHGAGHGKLISSPYGTRKQATTYGLDAQRLMRDGRVLPSAIAIAHDADLEVLARQCPEALPVAAMVGDICLDRLAVSMGHRAAYRRALGISEAHKLVVVSSTWGPDGMFGSVPDLLPTLMENLPGDGFRVGALLHPAVWAAHGHRQVRAWIRDCRRAGLLLPGPADDWRAVVAAADCVLGDHGSVPAYAAAMGLPLLRLGPPASTATPGSAQEHLARHAARFDPGRPVRRQIDSAVPLDRAAITARLTSRPGRAARLLRAEIYRLLRLAEPGRHREVEAVPAPGGTLLGAPS